MPRQIELTEEQVEDCVTKIVDLRRKIDGVARHTITNILLGRCRPGKSVYERVLDHYRRTHDAVDDKH